MVAIKHATETCRVLKVEGDSQKLTVDTLIQEDPLAIYVTWPGVDPRYFTTVLRTPGDDFPLAAGIAATELGVDCQGIAGVRYCVPEDLEQHYNAVTLALTGPVDLVPSALRTNSCGWCDLTDLGDKFNLDKRPPSTRRLTIDDLESLSETFNRMQGAFRKTGSSHGALLHTTGGTTFLGEDVGRHNALDKAIGKGILEACDLREATVLLSGRAGADLVAKSASIGASFVISVSAPSALAVQLAVHSGITLIGFLRPGRMNVYSYPETLEIGYEATLTRR